MKNHPKTMQEVFDACKQLIIAFKEFKEADFIVGISRGGLIPAALIATMLNKPLVAAYIDKLDNVYFDRGGWIADKKVIIVDDMTRTGKTLFKIRELIRQSNPQSVECAVLGMIEGNCELDPIRMYQIAEGNNIIFPWDYDFMEENANSNCCDAPVVDGRCNDCKENVA